MDEAHPELEVADGSGTPQREVNHMEGSPLKKRACLAVVIASLIASFACLAYPIYVIRPFRYQGPRELAAALQIIQIRPIVEGICVVFVLAALAWFWGIERRRWQRVLASVGAAFVCAFAVLSHVNIFELMFHPDSRPTFAAVQQLKVDPDDKVLAVKLGGSARAYPIRTIAYHHIINDVVGGQPIVTTY
jgi:hypothetical protein